MNKKALVLLIFFMLGLWLPTLSVATSYTVTQITNNNTDDYVPMIHGNYVVWIEYDGNDQEIFLYDIATGITSQITNNDITDGAGDIYGDKIVWTGWEKSYDGSWGAEIYLYDISTGITTEITNDVYDDWSPKIDGNKVVWYGFNGNDHEIYFYDITTGTTTQITNNNFDDSDPKISGDYIIWGGWVFENNTYTYNIYLYFVATGTTTIIASGQVGLYDTDGKYVVWQGCNGECSGGNDVEIYVYNISSGTTAQITNNNYFDYYPLIDSGKVVWTGEDGVDEEIFMYDTATGVTTKITDDTYEDDFSYIQNGHVVWHKHITEDPLNQEIFVYDIATGVTTQISNNTYTDWDPVVFNGNIAWYGFDGNDLEIYLATPAEITPLNAKIDIDPDTINLKSKGNWITCYIELPQGYDVNQIGVSTVTLSVSGITFKAALSPTEVGDYDNDGVPDLMVKFDRQAVHSVITAGTIEMIVGGSLIDGSKFQGTDTVLVIDKGKEHTDGVDHGSVEY